MMQSLTEADYRDRASALYGPAYAAAFSALYQEAWAAESRRPAGRNC